MPFKHLKSNMQRGEDWPVTLGQLLQSVMAHQRKTLQLGPDSIGYVCYSLCMQLVV